MTKDPAEVRLSNIEEEAETLWLKENPQAQSSDYAELAYGQRRKYLKLALASEPLVKLSADLDRELRGARRDVVSMQSLLDRRNETIISLQRRNGIQRSGR